MIAVAQPHQFTEQLKAAQEVCLRLARAGFVDAQVSGGFLRDAYIGRKPKDMDVFIGNQADKFDSQLEAAIGTALGAAVKLKCDMEYTEDSEVARIFDTSALFGDCPVQVIECAAGVDPLQRFDQHDWGLCQIAVGWDGHLRRSEAFSNDFLAGTCTLVRCENTKEHARSMRRWKRWEAEFTAMGIRMVDETPFGALGGNCLVCAQPFRWGHNVYSEAGRREIGISGLCETCFDRITAEPVDL